MEYLATLTDGSEFYFDGRQVLATSELIRSLGIGEFAPTPLTTNNTDSALTMVISLYGMDRIADTYEWRASRAAS